MSWYIFECNNVTWIFESNLENTFSVLESVLKWEYINIPVEMNIHTSIRIQISLLLIYIYVISGVIGNVI